MVLYTQFKINLSSCKKWARKLKDRFYCSDSIAVSLLLLHFLFAYCPAFYLNIGKKLWRHISFSSICFFYYKKHPNNHNKICPLPSSTCFQQHCHDWLLFPSTKSAICQIDANCSLFQSFNMLLFHIRLEYIKLIYYGLVSVFSKYYFKIGTICLFFVSSHVLT